MFQFHDGTITTWWSKPWNGQRITFQFHDGTITTRPRCRYYKQNPKFQFHDGTITTWVWHWNKRGKSVFQFHDGTITTRAIIYYRKALHGVSIPWWYDYNVQEKIRSVYIAAVSIPWWYDYNGQRNLYTCEWGRRFNSMMVRLQLYYGWFFPISSGPFQFHDGTITTNKSILVYWASAKFQFHDGTITTL